MKKNFVKKTLASTLALAMVATATPAAFTTASAAKAPALNKKAKTLYINDNEIGSSFDFNISNKVAKSTYKWTTSNKAVATVNSKGLTKAATKTGKATISCKITLPTKKTKTLKATVTVKENATKVWVKNAPEENTIKIGADAYDFDSSFSTASGAKATDYRTWEIDKDSNTADATIDAKSGVVTTTKAGEFKVRVRAYQNKAKLAANDTVDSEWLTVKVVPSIVDVKQSATSKVKVVFDDNMTSKVKASDFSITNKTTGAVMTISGISFSADGKEVTVATYGQYVDKGTYVLKYKDAEKDFETSIGAVESIELKTTTVNPNSAEKVEYVLKNANGVDITDTVTEGNVTYEIKENNYGFFDAYSKELTIFEKGKTAKVKLTYHTYKYNGTTEEGVKTVESVITCVDKTAATYGQYEKYTLSSDDLINWSKVSTTSNTVSVGQEKYLHLKAKDSAGNDASGFTFKTGNENVVLVTTDGNNCIVKGVKEGSTVVNVYKDDVYLWSLPVSVRAAETAYSIVLGSSSISVANNVAITDKAVKRANTVSIKVKNQYGEDFYGSNSGFKVDYADTKKESEAPYVSVSGSSLVVDGTKNYEGKDASAKPAKVGTYRYKVKFINSSTYAYFNVTVKEADPAVASIAVNLDQTAVNTTLYRNSKLSDSDIKLDVVGKDSQGLVIKDLTATSTVKVTGPNNGDYTDNFDAANGVFKAVSGSTIVKKVAVGSYRVEVKNGTTTKIAYFTVADEQGAPAFKVSKTRTAATTVSEAIQDCLVVDGTLYSEDRIVDFNHSIIKNYAEGDQIYIKTVDYIKTIKTKDGDVELTFTIPVNQTITYNIR